MITDKMRENAQKLTYIIRAYPNKPLAEIISLVQLPAIQTNAAIWAAVELGYIAEPDPQTGMVELKNVPTEWEFGEHEKDLEDHLVYCFSKLLAKEQDMEENHLASWTAGYGTHDIIIATKHLIEKHILAEYEVEDDENTYLFYTNYDTREQLWGKKQFKTEPKPPKKGKK